MPSLSGSFVFLSDLVSLLASGIPLIISPLYDQRVRGGISFISKIALPRSILNFFGSVPKVKVHVARLKSKLGRAGKILTKPEIGAIGAIAGGAVSLASVGCPPLVLAGGIAVIAAGSIEQMNREKAKEEIQGSMANEVVILSTPYIYSQRIRRLRLFLKIRQNNKVKRILIDKTKLKKFKTATNPGKLELAKGAVEMATKYMLGPASLAMGIVGKLGFIKTKIQASKSIEALKKEEYKILEMKYSILRENPGITMDKLSSEEGVKDITGRCEKRIKNLEETLAKKRRQTPSGKLAAKIRRERAQQNKGRGL